MKQLSLKFLLTLVAVITISGCTTIQATKVLPDDPEFAPILPEADDEPIVPTGSLFKASYVNNIYSDSKAHRVGDIISVILSENTQANKTAKTEVKKESNTTLKPILGPGGLPITANGKSLEFSVDQRTKFKGDSKADQGNSLNGYISVHVLRVLSNGNLIISGEKWITLNNGDEYIRLTGTIRPQDISSSNTILSNKVANARIKYAGTGAFADTNEQGWLVKFFNSAWWPL